MTQNTSASSVPHVRCLLCLCGFGIIWVSFQRLRGRKTEPQLMHRVDKTHFPAKYEEKAFLEAEFGRRLLAKQMAKEAMS
jgi:hypothetical protein